ncbi:CPBP family intramembrane glutamic endopeptidase [Streptomyces sp. NPDC060205]|uniref:CPBP family intramembrane glutamic endopeptidase n=1 Tax=Streptomyces sp. NPDC060205 TaxID=3347072 RepID=UPI00364CA19C
MSFSTAPCVPTGSLGTGAPLPYHRMAHVTGRHRWWRPLIGTVTVVGLWLLLFMVVDVVAYGVGSARGYPEDSDEAIDFGSTLNTALDLTYLALAIPVVLLVVRWVGRRPAGTVSSVEGRLRGRRLGQYVLVALPLVAAGMGAMLLVPAGEETAGTSGEVWVGLDRYLPALAMLVVLVPLQAAAEEYAFRGWLLQAVGGLFRSPWIAVLPQAVLFAAAHGWGTPAGFADLVVFGVLAGWLTVRTGGLEAAVALHAVNNLMSFALAAAFVGGLDSDETAADLPWQLAALDITVIVVFTGVVLWLERRRARSVDAPHPYFVDAQRVMGPTTS